MSTIKTIANTRDTSNTQAGQGFNNAIGAGAQVPTRADGSLDEPGHVQDFFLNSFLRNGPDVSDPRSMLVDGSITPVDFFIEPPAGLTYHIMDLFLVLADGSIDYLGFGGAAALTNGIKIGVGTEADPFIWDFLQGETIKTTGNMVEHTGSLAKTSFSGGAGADAMALHVPFRQCFGRTGHLLAGTNDSRLTIRIQDNLVAYVDELSAKVFGWFYQSA